MLLLGHIGIAIGAFYIAGRRIDYRYALAGSVLSDLIDKPLVLLLFGSIEYGRFIGHTLIFLLFWLLVGLKNKKYLLAAGGVAIHLILDEAWTFSETLFWPVSGKFTQYANSGEWLASLFQPYHIAGEIAGAAILLLIAWRHKLYMMDNIRKFLSTGKME